MADQPGDNPLPRLETEGMPAPWRLWMWLRGARHRRHEAGHLFNSSKFSRTQARARLRTLVDLGLWNDASSLSPDNLKWEQRRLGFSVYSSATAGRCDSAMLEMAFEGGLDQNWNEQNNYSNTWTTIFARTGQDECLRTCLAAGCDPLARDSCNDTALHLVLARASKTSDATTRINSLDMASEIIASGHPIDHPGRAPRPFDANRGKPVLQVPIEHGNVDIVRWLLDRGAGPDAADGYGDCSMHWLATSNFVDRDEDWGKIARLLMEHGAKIDATNPRGETPLWMAVAWGNVPAVEWLFNAGASTTTDPVVYRDREGREKPDVPAITLLMNVCQNLSACEPVALRLAHAILQDNPAAWDAPTPEGQSIREWLASQAGPWRALHDKLCLGAGTPQPDEGQVKPPRIRF